MSELYEKLGLFYLGEQTDPDGEPTGALELLQSEDLTTHAAIIGMTGSGKTGLGIDLLEEAAIDGIPALIIDPKGDMGDLLLAFEDLRPEDFAQWIDPLEAKKEGLGLQEYAAKIAKRWREGLERSHQSPERIKRLKNSANFRIYTPGSQAGIPVSILASFAPPSPAVRAETDTYAQILSSTVTALLALIGKEAAKSNEFVLLSNILDYYWRQDKELSLESLIANIIAPPFKKIGVLPLKSFYPKKERMELALGLNNLLSDPSFAAWTQGESLDISKLLYHPSGKPNHNIFYLAHLSEKERLFFVTLLLNRLLFWMRSQSGTSALRALLYMDEVYGYFPPNANPPSKKPMMLLLKQARAYGVGVVLSTQNPVDLDYKGLSNIGTWFLGRLQTRQDVERVIDGLLKSGQELSKSQLRTLLANLPKRTFLLRSVHKENLEIFKTRWALSFLKGPLSKEEIARLMADKKPKSQQSPRSNLTPPPSTAAKPLVSPQLPQYFDITDPDGPFEFAPYLLAKARLHYLSAAKGIDQEERIVCEVALRPNSTIDVESCEEAEEKPYATTPPKNASYAPLPSILADDKGIQKIKRSFKEYFYRTKRLTLYKVPRLRIESQPGESYEEFRARVLDSLRTKKEEAVAKLRRSYTTKFKRLQRRLAKAIQWVQKQEEEAKSQATDTILSLGLTLLDSLFGRKKIKSSTLSKAGSTIKKAKRAYEEYSDIEEAKEEVARLEEELERLQEELEEEIQKIEEKYQLQNYPIKEIYIKPRKSEIQVDLALLWHQI